MNGRYVRIKQNNVNPARRDTVIYRLSNGNELPYKNLNTLNAKIDSYKSICADYGSTEFPFAALESLHRRVNDNIIYLLLGGNFPFDRSQNIPDLSWAIIRFYRLISAVFRFNNKKKRRVKMPDLFYTSAWFSLLNHYLPQR